MNQNFEQNKVRARSILIQERGLSPSRPFLVFAHSVVRWNGKWGATKKEGKEGKKDAPNGCRVVDMSSMIHYGDVLWTTVP